VVPDSPGHMRTYLNILAACYFVLGVMVLPAAHMVSLGADRDCGSCSHDGQDEPGTPQKHDSDHCSICQLAHTPMTIAMPAIVVTALVGEMQTVRLPQSVPTCSTDHVLPFSCGPPA
jgi:hypothetical protein